MNTGSFARLFFALTLLAFFVSGAAPARAQMSADLTDSLELMESLEDLIRFTRPSANVTLRYSNNQVATNVYGSPSATWYWPNGKVLSNQAGSPNATWYWPNGATITNLIGSPNATWRWPDGQIMALRGPGFSEEELRNTPKLAVKILRLAARRGR